MWHLGQEIRLIRPMCEKWEPKRSAWIFSFVLSYLYYRKQPLMIFQFSGSPFPNKAFLFYKGNLRIYKGKYASRAFWLSFLTHWSNQSNFLTRLPYFYWRFSRHPYWYDLCPPFVITDIWHYWHMNLVDSLYKWNMVCGKLRNVLFEQIFMFL